MQQLIDVLRAFERLALDDVNRSPKAVAKELSRASMVLKDCQASVEARKDALALLRLSEDPPAIGDLHEASWSMTGLRYVQVVLTYVGMAVQHVDWWTTPFPQEVLRERWIDVVEIVHAHIAGLDWPTVRAWAEQELTALVAADQDRSMAILAAKVDELLANPPAAVRSSAGTQSKPS